MPNTSDASDQASVRLGRALFESLGVSADSQDIEPTGVPFAREIARDLSSRVDEVEGDVRVAPEQRLNEFQQYRHVGAINDIKSEPSPSYDRSWRRLKAEVLRRTPDPPPNLSRLERLIEDVEDAVAQEVEARRAALDEVGSESLLKLDVTAARMQDGRLPELLLGLSLKWTLRTDRAQDCRSQGAKLSSLRRGRMPHFATITMEPRPYMLNLLGGGSGDVDCVYHLHLPALTGAVESVYGQRGDVTSRRTLDTFRRLVEQRRVRDYDELVEYTTSL